MTAQLPAHLQGRQSSLAQGVVSTLGIGSPPYLSIMSNEFNLIRPGNDPEPAGAFDQAAGRYFDCVIFDRLERMTKIYWGRSFADDGTPPDCFSDNGVAPSMNASVPQSPICASCPHAAWGSKISEISGNKIKACSDFQKIALVAFDANRVPVPGFWLLRIPPNSLRNFSAYASRFVGQGIDLDCVVTRITFQKGSIGTLEFRAVEYVAPEMLTLTDEIRSKKQTDGMVGRLDVPRQAALPAPSLAVAPPAVAAPAQAPIAIPHVPASSFVPPAAPAPAAVQQPVQPAAAPARSGRRGRPRATAEPATVAGSVAPVATAQPGPVQPNGPTPPTAFGIGQGESPDNKLQATLTDIFGP